MDIITVYKTSEFRKWLRVNHKKERKVAVVLYKKHTGKPAPSHRELIEEAICYGWIDTTVNRRDENTYVRHFTKRTDKSTWSDNTLSYARDLIKNGRMAEQGRKYYELGRRKPTHDDNIPKNPDMPDELKKALSKNKKAKEKFDKFPPSTKKMLYRWLLSGMLAETRKKRVRHIIEEVKNNNRNLLR